MDPDKVLQANLSKTDVVRENGLIVRSAIPRMFCIMSVQSFLLILSKPNRSTASPSEIEANKKLYILSPRFWWDVLYRT